MIDTVWDLLNVLYDAGMSIYAVSTGDSDGAKAYLVDLGCDAFAMIIPGLPAGASKLAKAGVKGATKQGSKQAAKQVVEQGAKKVADKSGNDILSRMQQGKVYNVEVKAQALSEGRKVATEKRLVPMNGVGNKPGNVTTVDMLEQLPDETARIYENKLTDLVGLSPGQKAAKAHVDACKAKGVRALFEVRSEIPEFGLRPNNKIKVVDYKINYKEIKKGK